MRLMRDIRLAERYAADVDRLRATMMPVVLGAMPVVLEIGRAHV